MPRENDGCSEQSWVLGQRGEWDLEGNGPGLEGWGSDKGLRTSGQAQTKRVCCRAIEVGK